MERIYPIICICCLVTAFLFPTIGQAEKTEEPEVSGQNAVLIDQNSGRILFEKNAHDKQPIASITKVMTAIIAIESEQMQEEAVTSERAISTEGSSLYLEKGEKMTINDLVYGLMLRSGNDASVSISEHIGGSVEGFVYLMNEKARWLGMTDTHFTNPHGLDDTDHYSTAYDMAILMQYAMENDEFKKIAGTKSYTAEKRVYPWKNKNKLLTSYYDYCVGGKTGFTRKSGRTLVTAAEKNDMELVAVTLDAHDDWRDHTNLFEWGFKKYDNEKILTKGEHTYTTDETEEPVTGMVKEDIYFPLLQNEKVTKQTHIDEYAIKEKRPIIGSTTYYIDHVRQKKVPIYSSVEVDQTKNGFSSLFKKVFKQILGA